MQFTKTEGYGVSGILYLATKERNTITPLAEIAMVKNIPEKFLAKIFQSLSRSGIVDSQRGASGGFTLSRDPSEITIKEVLESIQGPYHLMKCIPNRTICSNEGFCALRELLIKAEDSLVHVFEQYTLADLNNWEATENNITMQKKSLLPNTGKPVT